jgi:uncharacterized protein (DUF2235 family)
MLEIGPEEHRQPYHFFFFINTKSGNREGQQIMSHRNVSFDSHFSNRNEVKLSFVDLFDSENRMS